MANSGKTAAFRVFLADLSTLLLEGVLYFVSFAVPVCAIQELGVTHPLALLFAAIVSWLGAAIIFMGLLVFLKRTIVGEVPYGRFYLTSPKAYRWIAADKLVKIVIRSPFHNLINETGFLRYFFYRGMGAHISTTLRMGNGVKLPEPWAVTMGSHVHIGDEAVLAGHKVEGNVVTLDRIEIGDNVLIGARAIVFPGVTIGNGAIVGANSVVTRGTTIGPGEIWSGNPAQKIERFRLASAAMASTKARAEAS
jgi:acetyltransferase-like isoleucine patch superfamily enzyme